MTSVRSTTSADGVDSDMARLLDGLRRQTQAAPRAPREHEAPLRGIGPDREHDRRAGELGGDDGHGEVRRRDLHGRRINSAATTATTSKARDLREA
jgi:hypothetical protein